VEILLLVRLDAGYESVHVEPVSARGVVGEVLASMSPAAAQGGLTLRVEPIDAGIVVRTDGKKLQQILVSLVSNAVKFTKRGEIVIRAFTRDDRVVFEVQDSGVGIGGDSLEHIFDPFWQVEQTKTRRSGGSGLGLTVARRLAQLLGGDLSADSTPAVGSTFRVALPTLAAQRA
jgi:signal transduction histidine kinase